MTYQYPALHGDSSGKGAWANRRASVRYQCGPATSGRVILVEKHEFQRAWVLDLSKVGVGLLVSRPLEVGLFVYIQLKSTHTCKMFELPAHVAHATAQPGGDWVIGCELVSKLTDDEMDALL